MRNMLIQFNFKNHKTFLNENSLDMRSASIKEHECNTFIGADKNKYLRSAAIYGANGSGKSNVLDAFIFMQFCIQNSFDTQVMKDLEDTRFKFCNDGTKSAQSYEVFFSIDKTEFQYGFTYENKRFIEEWLNKKSYVPVGQRYKNLFKRDKGHINISNELSNLKGAMSLLNENSLVISLLSKFKFPDINNVVDWFNQVRVLDYGDLFYEMHVANTLPLIDYGNEIEKNQFLDFLRAIDIGIDDIRVVKTTTENASKPSYKFFTVRKNFDTGELVEMPFHAESSGTLKITSMYTDITKALKNGYLIFIDELDAKLHPLLTKYIVSLFHNNETNIGNGQLIFTTHNTDILKKDVFRRDQIWFTNKDAHGVSELYSLIEFKDAKGKKIRNDASYDTDYLSGRFGAIPELISLEFDNEKK